MPQCNAHTAHAHRRIPKVAQRRRPETPRYIIVRIPVAAAAAKDGDVGEDWGSMEFAGLPEFDESPIKF